MLFNRSIQTGQVPEDWRSANISAIYKKGNKSDPLNYRPISLTCIIGKMLETIIKTQLVKFLDENNKIKDSQHGFTKGKSCNTNLLEARNYICESVDQGVDVDIVYLDFQKAFDKVPHQRLLYKLEAVGVKGELLNWIKNWLSDRKQRVVIQGETTVWKRVTSGVPQGSVLGPILFLIYVNDLDENIVNKLLKFADDTKLLGKVSTPEEIQQMKDDLHQISVWTEKWQMSCNLDKCKVMHIGKNNQKINYEFGGQLLDKIDREKDLGVLFSSNLKVEDQCAQAANKANRLFGLVKRTFANRDKNSMLILYKSLIRPHLDYCTVAWRPQLTKDIDKLERIQRRITKSIKECKGMQYVDRLNKLHLTTLETRRSRADLLQVYRIMNKIDKLEPSTYFTTSLSEKSSSLRGHSQKILKTRFKTNIGKSLFKNRVINDWNNLSEKDINVQDINTFKNRIDNYLKINRGLN